MAFIVVPFLSHLPGGFSKFQAEFPTLCETNLDGSSNSSSPTAQVLGLGGLRISSDSSDIESDIDRDPCSATDSDGSPLSNPQPSFPVEILPHLYLGCAKDATNLDVLEEYGIKYILNVTPNLPNLFENAGEFKYKQIPISDHWSQNLSQFFPEAIGFIGKKSCTFFFSHRNFRKHYRKKLNNIIFSTILWLFVNWRYKKNVPPKKEKTRTLSWGHNLFNLICIISPSCAIEIR